MRGGCPLKKTMRSHRSGAERLVRPASPRFRLTDRPGASRHPSSARRGIPLGPTKNITVITTLAPRGVAHLHLFKLFVLNLHGQIQNGFNGAACLGLKLGGRRILFENRAAEADVPFFVRLYAFPIELRSCTIAGGFAKLNELLVLFQCERLARELCGADAFDCRFETCQKLEHRTVTIRRRIESAQLGSHRRQMLLNELLMFG